MQVTCNSKGKAVNKTQIEVKSSGWVLRSIRQKAIRTSNGHHWVHCIKGWNQNAT